jgi:hypothetical protein
MKMPVSAAVERELKSAEAAILEVKKILNGNKYTDEEYSTVVVGFIAQGIEHHEALILLTRSGLTGSAFALVRSIVEGLARGVWFTVCANQTQVLKFRNEDQIDQTFGEMSDAIDAQCGIDFFHDFKDRSWKTLNSYTHTGILQIGRRFTGHDLVPSYRDSEITEMMRVSTTCILLIVRPYLVRQGHKDSARAINALGERYTNHRI